MPGHDGVLFDLDGVLVDSRAPFARSINCALVAHGEPERPEEDLHRYLGPPLHQTFETLVVDQTLVQPCVEHYRERYRAFAASETTVFPGIRPLLEALSNRLPLVVATSKPHALAEPLLDSLGLRSFFLDVVGPDLAAEHEDKAVTVGRAIAALGPATQAIMVGDRKYDIAAAHEHDLPAVGVLWGVGAEQELVAAGADTLARTPGELADFLVGEPRSGSMGIDRRRQA